MVENIERAVATDIVHSSAPPLLSMVHDGAHRSTAATSARSGAVMALTCAAVRKSPYCADRLD